MSVKTLSNDSEFQPELANSGSRLVVVAFVASWNSQCQQLLPFIGQLSTKYPRAVFLEVDVEQCQTVASRHGVASTLPSFLFFRNKVRVDQLQTAEPGALEEKVKQHLESDGGSDGDGDIPRGYMDLGTFIYKAGCECLNESDEHGFENCLQKDSTFLESDCDEQLIVSIAFTQPVKLYSFKLLGPDNGQGPKTVKIFINQTRSMDFDQAETSEPTQTFVLSPEDIQDDGVIQLRYVKYQNVNNVTVFIKDNHGAEETTRVTYLTFVGTPVQATNMSDFKRIAGKKGESH
uniref:Thioredoxin-like 1 n=1 Tax=Eptatretus burgeri TaxID=7764 RepID=A0A8C4QSI9_EPTBU